MQKLFSAKEESDPFRPIDQSRDAAHKNKQPKQLNPYVILPLFGNFRILACDWSKFALVRSFWPLRMPFRNAKKITRTTAKIFSQNLMDPHGIIATLSLLNINHHSSLA
jgi:hypothetical protein